ncbi:MAG: thioredoxin family protein [Candidatus Eisenbacteria bacterium]
MAVLLVLGAALAVAPGPARAATPATGDSTRALQQRADSLIAIETRVYWERTPPESALAAARRDGRPAFLDFYATWCAPCRWMDRVVYSDPLLSEVAEGVVMIRVDIDRPEGRALAARYEVTAYPTLVHVSPEGKETLRWVGPLNLRDLRLNLGQAAVPGTRRAEVVAQVAKRPLDAVTQSSAALFYGCRGEVENARAVVQKYERMSIGAPARDRAPVFLSLGKAEEFAGRDERAIEAYGRVLSVDPEGAWAWRAWLGLSACLERRGRPGEALSAAREAVRLGPQQRYLEARLARLELGLPRPAAPPGVDDGPERAVAR